MRSPCRRIILVTVDSLRPDFLGAYGSENATPSMDALAGEGVLFERAFATGPDTTHSFPGILASNYPTTGGTVQHFGPRLSVAEVLRRAGFRTAAFHSNPLLSRAKGYGGGFECFWDSLPSSGEDAAPAPTMAAEESRAAGLKRALARKAPRLFRLARGFYRTLKRRSIPLEQPHEPAEAITRRATEWLAGAGDPTFLWVHYMDPHWPYGTHLDELSEEERRLARQLSETALKYPRRLGTDGFRRLKDLYAAEVRSLDRSLGELFGWMRRSGAWETTAVFLTSDHGQAFGEHGTCFHGDLLYEELIRVPLIAKLPGEPARTESAIASLIDLAPTLCAVAEVQSPATFEGRSLLEGSRKAVFAEAAYRSFVSESPRTAAARTDEWKLIRDLEKGTEELYRLTRDPGEEENLLERRPPALRPLRGLLESHLERERPAVEQQAEAPAVSAEEQEALKRRLRALGYLDEAGEDGPRP